MKRFVTRMLSGIVGMLAALLISANASAQGSLGERETEGTTRRAELPVVEGRMLATVAGPVDPMTYVVGPGDLLEVHFSGSLSQSIPISVGPEGNAFVRGFGPVRIGGLTLDAARREIRRILGGDLRRDVSVDVQLMRVRILRVFPTGLVNNAALTELPATARVSDALDAGARVLPGGSRRNIEVRRRDGTRALADLDRYLRLGDTSANPTLRDDDVLSVPAARAFIEVSGAVARPGRLELGATDSLRTLLELSGGVLASARSERALFVRWNGPASRESTWVSIDEVVSGRTNPPLRDGDWLFVYFLPEYHRLESATVTGEVTRPGVYPLQPGVTRLSDLIQLAGGFQPRADLNAIRIYRPRGGSTEPDAELERLSRLSRNEMTASEYEKLRSRTAQRREDYRVNWNRLGRAKDEDVVLVTGDIVRVDPVVAAVRVEGEVRRPGLVNYAPGTPLASYVAYAGGYSARAAGSRTLVTRAVTGQTLPAREVSDIAPGDMIWVPERPDRTLWQNLGTLIAVSAQVATIIIAVRR